METKFLELKEGTIAYDERGEGPLVVAVPGLGDIRQQYRFLAPAMAEAGFRVVTMDVRGHGESSVGWDDYSDAALGADIIALIRHLDAGPALVVGNSKAGGAAIWTAVDAPDLVRGLVLVDPFVRGTVPDWVARWVYQPIFSGPWAVAAWLFYYKTLYPTRQPADFEQYLAQLRANLSQPGRMAAVRGMFTASHAETESRLDEVSSPTLIVMGSKDPDFKSPQAEAEWLAGRLNGRFYMVKGAGHYPPAEMPEESARVVIDFARQAQPQEFAYVA